MSEVADAPVDDLTDEACLTCGSRHDLTRTPSLYLDGEFYGPVYCQKCERDYGL